MWTPRPVTDAFAVPAAESADRPRQCAKRLLKDGLLIVRGALPVASCDLLAAGARASRQTALARPRATWPEDFSLTIACPQHRHDLKLRLSDAGVADALHVILGGKAQLSSLLEHSVGADASVCELAVLSAACGATRQPWHRDTSPAAGRTILTAFVALQDTPGRRGATLMRPGTHRTGESPPAPSAEEDCVDGEAWAVELQQGDCCLMDSRLLHCGGAHVAPQLGERLLFYFSVLICGTTGQGSTLTLRRGYEHRFLLGSWRAWSAQSGMAIEDETQTRVDKLTNQGGEPVVRLSWMLATDSSEDDAAPWRGRAELLRHMGLAPAGLDLSTELSFEVPTRLAVEAAAALCADATDLYFAGFPAQWLPGPAASGSALTLLGPAAAARGKKLQLSDTLRPPQAVAKSSLDAAAALSDPSFGPKAAVLRAAEVSDRGLALAFTACLLRKGKVIHAGRGGLCWDAAVSIEMLDSLPGPMAEAAQELLAGLEELHSTIAKAWGMSEGAPSLRELRLAQGLLDSMLCEAFPGGEALLRQGRWEEAALTVGPLSFDVDAEDPLGAEKMLVLFIQGIPTEHWLRLPTAAPATVDASSPSDRWPPRWHEALPLGGGMSPHVLRCFRVLLASSSPAALALDSAPFAEPELAELDLLCLQTLLATLEQLEEAARQDAAAAASGSATSLPEQHAQALADYSRAQAKLLASNAEVLRQLLACAAARASEAQADESEQPPGKRLRSH
ncbi:unnamed protein product [Polarella glacialis]|uniref:Uncharacterized protein n=1 Tax=Polarella glacialis TaxID=89957 RepID=A0A813K2I6_POLGL|nr:unnamed protein product [Polarella glacialis]